MVATACLLWLITDVSPGEVAMYLLYLIGVILLPGVSLYLVLSGQRELDLRAVALGAPLGYALELGAFALGAASGQRYLGVLLPLAAGGLAAGALIWRRQVRAPTRSSPYFAWILALTCIVVVGMIGERYFATTPLPGTVPEVEYYPDVIWQAAVAGEALHHWPLDVPSLAGLPLNYHYFSFMHMAATSYATGIDLTVVDLRLYVIPLVLLLALQLVVAGRALDRRWVTGLVALALVFLVGEASPWPQAPAEAFPLFFLSASFVYGYVFFIPLVLLLLETLSACGVPKLRQWTLLAIFLLAAMGAKGAILPVITVGLGIAALYALRFQRSLVRRVAGAAALSAAALLLSQWLIYEGGTAGAQFELFAGVEMTEPFRLARGELPGPVPEDLYLAIAAIPVAVKLMIPVLLGIVALYWLARRPPTLQEAVLLGILLSSLGFMYAFGQVGASQTYFFWYGYGAAALLAAIGWRSLGGRVLRSVRPPRAVLATVGVVALIGWTADSLFDDDPASLWRYLEGEQTFTSGAAVTPAVTEAMRWLRDNSDEDAVFAVSNQYSPNRVQARACYYTALAERRSLLECEYGQGEVFPPLAAVKPSLHPFAERLRLNQRLFRGDPGALEEAGAEYGLDFLVLDKRFGDTGDPTRLRKASRATELFENAEIAIYGRR